MFSEKRSDLYDEYTKARAYFVNHPDELIEIEKYVTQTVNNLIDENYKEIESDYNEASYLNPLL